MPILENAETGETPGNPNSPGAPGVLSYFKQGSARSTGFQVTTEGVITSPVTFSGDVSLINTASDTSGQVLFAKSLSPNSHAITAYQADTTGTTNSAINAVSDNTNFSAVQITGKELNKGTLKIAHKGQADGSDASAAAISIDLQTTVGGVTGTAAQGIFITSTTDTAGSTGNAMTVRYNSSDYFVVKGATAAGSGVVGIGVATGHVPSGMLEIAQKDTTTFGLQMTALAGGTDMINLKDSGGNQRFQVNNSGNLITRATALLTSAVQIGSATADLGGGTLVLSMKDAGTKPTTNPTGGTIIYSDSTGGATLKARDVNGNVFGLTPTFVKKTADQSVTSSVTTVADNELLAAVSASSSYEVELFLIYDGATAGDLRLAFTVPAGSTFHWTPAGLDAAATGVSGSVNLAYETTGEQVIGAAGAGTKTVAVVKGRLYTGVTTGSLTLKWAQGTSSGTATTIYTGSTLTMRRVQ